MPTGRCLRTALREVAESSIASSRPSHCAARLFAPFAFEETSHTFYQRPRSLHSDSTLWQRRGGTFCSQRPTMARCHTVWLLVPLVRVASFHLSEKDIAVFPRPRLSQLVPAHGPENCSQADYQQRSTPSEHSCSARLLPLLRLTDRSLGPVRSTSSASFRLSSTTLMRATDSLRAWTRFN